MDYPKSVPGVGLVDGKFVDEDQVNGTPGSLIPAQWGNDVTEEILNVVREVGDVPAEASKNQLVGAIWKMFRSATAVATEVFRGVLRVGTQAEVNAGELDDVAVTPKKLRLGFSISLAQAGYIAFPIWLGGLIVQWGAATTSGGAVTVTYPIAYPVKSLAMVMTPANGGAANYLLAYTGSAIGAASKSQMLVYGNSNNTGGTVSFNFISLGH